MEEIYVELNGQVQKVSKQELFDLGRQGKIGPETYLWYNKKSITYGQIKGLVFNSDSNGSRGSTSRQNNSDSSLYGIRLDRSTSPPAVRKSPVQSEEQEDSSDNNKKIVMIVSFASVLMIVLGFIFAAVFFSGSSKKTARTQKVSISYDHKKQDPSARKQNKVSVSINESSSVNTPDPSDKNKTSDPPKMEEESSSGKISIPADDRDNGLITSSPSDLQRESGQDQGDGSGPLKPAAETTSSPSDLQRESGQDQEDGSGPLKPAAETTSSPSDLQRESGQDQGDGSGPLKPAAETTSSPSDLQRGSGQDQGDGSGPLKPAAETTSSPSTSATGRMPNLNSPNDSSSENKTSAEKSGSESSASSVQKTPAAKDSAISNAENSSPTDKGVSGQKAAAVSGQKTLLTETWDKPETKSGLFGSKNNEFESNSRTKDKTSKSGTPRKKDRTITLNPPRTASEKEKNEIPNESAAAMNEKTPFDEEVKKLPPRYKGHDIEKLYLNILTMDFTRNDYETKSEYKKNIQKKLEDPFWGELSLTSTFAVMFHAKARYNADKKTLYLPYPRIVRQNNLTAYRYKGGFFALEISISGEFDSYIAHNAFNASVKVDETKIQKHKLIFPPFSSKRTKANVSSYDQDDRMFPVKMDLELAREIGDSIACLVVFKLYPQKYGTGVYSNPFVEMESGRKIPKYNDPNDIKVSDYGLYAKDISLVYYNFETGEIYLYITLKDLADRLN